MKSQKKLISIFFFLLYSTFIISNDSFLSVQNEFEADLVKLLTKLHQKKKETKNDLVSVRVRNVYDLQEQLEMIKKNKENIISEKNQEIKDLNSQNKKMDSNLNENKTKLADLKVKYDKVIEQNNLVNNQSNLKRSNLSDLKSAYQNAKSDFDESNEKFLNNLISTGKLLNGSKKTYNNEENNSAGLYLNFNDKISNLENNLAKRNLLQEDILKSKESTQKIEIQLNKLNSVANESRLDKKLFNILNSNIQANMNQLKSGILNSTIFITSLNKIINDKENRNKLEIEKTQQNEVFADTNKNIKNLLSALEQSQVEVKDLMKKKSKVQEELLSREIENNIKSDRVKSEIVELNSEIKKAETEMLTNVKNQKSVKIIF
jgi:hypothetical protein